MTDGSSDLRRVGTKEEISLYDVVGVVKKQWNLVLGLTAIVTAISLLYAILTTPTYTASVSVQPATEDGSGLSSLANQFSGVASLAGVGLSGTDSQREEYLGVLRSRELGNSFIKKYRLKPNLFPEQWDSEAGKWKEYKPGLKGKATQALSSLLAIISEDEGWKPTISSVPSDWDAYNEFTKVRRIDEDNDTGLVTVSMEFRNPYLAAKWANNYVALANSVIRQRTIDEANRALSYLNKEVDKTSVAGLRDSIYHVVETQLERITLANTRKEYAFRVIDSAVVPENRTSPRRILVVIAGLLFGLFIGITAAIARGFRNI